jgi:trimeric autotransporter adhesin
MNPKCRKIDERTPSPHAQRPALDLLIATAIALLAWLLIAGKAHAATESTEIRCVSNSMELADALGGSQSPNINVAIRVRQGTYTLGAVNATFAAPMSIRGGWSDASCNDNAARTINPGNTVIDLSGTKFTLKQPEGPSRASIVIEGVTFRNGDSMVIGSGTSHDISNDPGDLTVRRSRFTGFSPAGTPFATLDFDVATGTGLLENVLMDHISAPTAPTCAVGLYVDGASANFGANFVTADVAGAVCLANGPSQYVSNAFALSNSIFWSSTSGPPTIAVLQSGANAPIGVIAQNAIVHLLLDQDGDPFPFFGQIDADPAWNSPLSGDYVPAPGSPAVDAGVGDAPLGLPSTDMLGQTRPTGAEPDLGALEWNGSAIATVIVSNTNDGGGGSLRQAILDSNANANPVVAIAFQIPGSCPHTIALQSTLPGITNGLRINGYTQPDSIPNADDDAFDANLCVVVKPASGTLSTGFRVPAGSNGTLSLSGVALGGFDQPVLLLGGGEHKITGIQIGGNVNGIALPGPAINGISVATASVDGITIGGLDPSERNVIGGGSVGTAINLQPGDTQSGDSSHCRVVNNSIGVGPNGTSAMPMAHGITLSADHCLVNRNRIAGATHETIWINGGHSNVVQGNAIGFGIDGLPTGTSQVGVLITGGTSNTIGGGFHDGMTPGSPLANTIRYMSSAGVIVEGDIWNSIRGNIMLNLSSPIAIDLGGDGPTPNDFNDSDAGANGLQNFATVEHLAYVAPAAPDAHDVQAYVFGQLLGSVAGLNRVDAYFYNGSCAPGDRGRPEHYIGSFLAFTFASGIPSDFNYVMTLPNVATDGAIAFTATNPHGDTSEVGTCYRVANAPTWDDVIFWNDFE